MLRIRLITHHYIVIAPSEQTKLKKKAAAETKKQSLRENADNNIWLYLYIMDELTKQKIPIIIKQHILQTKIGYLVEKMSLEKRKCKKEDDVFNITEEQTNHKDMVLIRRTSIDNTKGNSAKETETKVVTADKVLSLGKI